MKIKYQNQTRYFCDGRRKIDFVIAYRKNTEENLESGNAELRNKFVRKLRNMGIEVEDTGCEDRTTYVQELENVRRRYSRNLLDDVLSATGKRETNPEQNVTQFLKLHATMRFLYKYAEIMSLNMRLKDSRFLQAKIDQFRKADEDDE